MRNDSIYVMWSAQTRQSKIGLSFSPHARASQLRRERSDYTIKLVTCWDITTTGIFHGSMNLEFAIHESLRTAGFGRLDSLSEWFGLRWPTAVEFIEQFAQLYAPTGLALRSMPGNHGR